jgi:magnesium transporter
MTPNPSTEARDLKDQSRDLRDHWHGLSSAERHARFFALPRPDAEEIFMSLSPADQVEILSAISPYERRSWLRFLPPDDAADFMQALPRGEREAALLLLDERTRRDVLGLLAYEEDEAGGLMNPEYFRLRPDMTVDEAIRYLRAQARTRVESIYYAYVLDAEQMLLGVVSFRDLLLAPADRTIREIMERDIVSVPEEMNGEDIATVFSKHSDILAIPVLDAAGFMKGIVTYDDIASLVQKETTADIQKLGGMSALEASYFKVGFFEMVKKRAGWLTILFLGEMLTATAMGYYEHEIARAVVLALFVPLIISSGGNSGSQATTLIIRSLAVHDIKLRDWARVMGREVLSGLTLGAILGCIGLARIVLWHQWRGMYGEHYLLVAITVALSLVGVVLWGTLSGSMLPFLLRRLGLDPATSSAPFVATMVDVTGLIIYFSVASAVLEGTLL